MPLKPAGIPELFGIDSRALTVFRIGLASVLLYDLLVRSFDLVFFYTDAGVLPRELLWDSVSKHPFSLFPHFMSGSLTWQAVLFLIHALCALAVLLGKHTRLAVLMSWILTISLQDRNPAALIDGADAYLRILLFWSLFLPLGDPPKPARTRLSTGTAVILLQIVLLYGVTALHKLGTAHWMNGTAVQGVLSYGSHARPLALWLAEFPRVTVVLNYAVMGFELLGPLLLLCPFKTARVRSVVVPLFVTMHVVFFLALGCFYFQLMSAAAILLFLPGRTWNILWPAGNASVPEPQAGEILPRTSTGVLCLFFFVCVLAWNTQSLTGSKWRVPAPLHFATRAAHLDQHWTMFVGSMPPSNWIVVAGTLVDGRQVDLLKKKPSLSWEEPERPWSYLDLRRQKYFSFISKRDRRLAQGYFRYLCRNWNAAHEDSERLRSIEVVRMMKVSETDFRKLVVLRHDCAGKAHAA